MDFDLHRAAGARRVVLLFEFNLRCLTRRLNGSVTHLEWPGVAGSAEFPFDTGFFFDAHAVIIESRTKRRNHVIDMSRR
jgi:hypothetical protein